MALWGALGAAARRYLERARDLEWEQERRLLEAYVRGRDQRRRGRKRRNREQERRLLGTHGRLRPSILLAPDGSEDAALAARAASDLSDRARVRLHVVHVWQGLRPATLPAAAIDPYPRAYKEWEREAGELLGEQTEHLRSAGSTVAGAHLRKGRPAEEIVVLAEELGAGIVVVGSRGLGAVKRLVVGSVAEGVVSLAPCPVLVMRGGEGAWPPSRIVVGDDPSEGAKEAGEVAVAMAAILGAGVSLVRAYPLFLDISEAAKLKIRFISAEPLLGPLPRLNVGGLHWVITGGESGNGHRPIDPQWVRDIRDKCLAKGVAFFHKQWGGRTPKAGGRTLDGRTWDEFPKVPLLRKHAAQGAQGRLL